MSCFLLDVHMKKIGQSGKRISLLSFLLFPPITVEGGCHDSFLCPSRIGRFFAYGRADSGV